MIEVVNLTKVYSNTSGLKSISFRVEKGSVCSLLGENGAGKTTTFEIIAKVRKKDSGQVLLNGLDIDKHPDVLNTVGFMMQDCLLPKKIKVREAVKLFCSFYNNKQNSEALLQNCGLFHKREGFFENLSGGEKQRLFLSLALAGEPEILVLDEPFTALDPKGVKEFLLLISKMKSAGKTVLLSTHNIDIAERISDDIIIINSGEIKAQGTVEQIREKYKLRDSVILKVDNDDILNEYIEALKMENIFEKFEYKLDCAVISATDISKAVCLVPKVYNKFSLHPEIEIKRVALENIFIGD